MRRAAVAGLVALTLACAQTASATLDATIAAGANWLLGQQTPAGLYPWTVGQPVNPNATGAIARGMLGAYVAVPDPGYLTASTRTGNAFLTSPPRQFPDGSADFYAQDVLFLEELSLVTGDAQWAGLAQTAFWNRLAAGTYGANHDQNAAEWALAMPEWPEYASWTSLKPYYRAMAAVAAHVAGETQARDAFMADLVRTLELASGTEKRADLTGIAAAVWASAHTGYNLDPKAGRWRNHNSTAHFVATLVSYQRPGGDWPYDTSNGAARHVGDVSVTSWAVTALEAWSPTPYSDNIARGIEFMQAQQQPNGQILTNPGYPPTTTTGVLVHADAIGAMAVRGGVISGPPSGGSAPAAAFSASPTSGEAPLTVSFTDASTGSPTGWAWDFQNDGVVDSTAPNPQFTYTSPGSYTVKLTVTNGQGSDEEVKTNLVTVSTPPPPPPPTAAFSASPTSGEAPLTVSFTDASTGSPTGWAWDFQNDGVVDSTAPNPQFTYTSPGSYTVKLTVTNGQGSDEEVQTNLVTVSAPSASQTFLPSDDAYVASSNPDANFGQATTLRARPGVGSYLKFTVAGAQSPSRVTLRLFVTDVTVGTLTAYAVPDTSWSESTISWATAPPTAEALGTATAPVAGVWIELDLGTVPGSGTYSFAVGNSSTNVVWFSSGEGGNPPELVVRPV